MRFIKYIEAVTFHYLKLTLKKETTLKKKYTPQVLKECDLYVTVEPCIMCASLLRQFGIRKVYYGATNDKFGGTGGVLNIHQGNGASQSTGKEEGDYEVSGGWLREEAILLLRRFYVQENERGIVFFQYIPSVFKKSKQLNIIPSFRYFELC